MYFSSCMCEHTCTSFFTPKRLIVSQDAIALMGSKGGSSPRMLWLFSTVWIGGVFFMQVYSKQIRNSENSLFDKCIFRDFYRFYFRGTDTAKIGSGDSSVYSWIKQVRIWNIEALPKPPEPPTTQISVIHH